MRHKIVDKIDDLFLELEIPKVLQMDLAKSRADNFRLIHSGREAQRRSRYASLVTPLHNYGVSRLVMKNSEWPSG
jgi:hypothetical protein